jgi:serine/threonine protein kinase
VAHHHGEDLPIVLSPDTLLAGKYRIVSVIGEGGYGKVYLGYDPGMDRQVAIKELLHDAATSSPEDWQRYRTRFQREAQIVSQFSHPNVVSAYALETDDAGSMYLVMEYVDGGSLKQRLDRESPLDTERALNIAIDICRAIEAIYRRDIVHRDIKPSNILLDHDGGAKLTDFGVAQVGHETRRTQEAVGHPGTPAYKSPEQATTTGYLDQRSDLYSLGLVMYEMLTGHLYVRNRLPPRQYHGDIPPALNDIVMKALEENPGDRYQTAEEMCADLERVRQQSFLGQMWIVLRGLRSRPVAIVVGIIASLIFLISAYRFSWAVLRILAAPEGTPSFVAEVRSGTPTFTPMASVVAEMSPLSPVPPTPTATLPATYTPTPSDATPTSTSTSTPQPTVGAVDVYEPDEKSPAPIVPGDTQRRAFDPDNDVDRVTFRVKAGRSYVVTTSNLANGVDTAIEVLVNGSSLTNDNDSSGTLASQVALTASEDGMAVVTITNLGPFGPASVYDLSVFEAQPTETPVSELSETASLTTTVYATFTPRPTFTPYETETSTPIGATYTPTYTPTETLTPTRTPTLTRTITRTRTITPTRTETRIPTPTPTITLTRIPSDTPPPTLTPTPDRSPLPVKTVAPPQK